MSKTIVPLHYSRRPYIGNAIIPPTVYRPIKTGSVTVTGNDFASDVSMTDKQSQSRKVFVGGLGQGTNEYSMKAYFSQYGTVESALVVIDRMSQRSRGFGFVTFVSDEAFERCLSAKHRLDGISCEVRRAVPREEARDDKIQDLTIQSPKIFVGGLPEEMTEDRLREHFEQFGRVRQASLMYDKNSHRPRGFGFVLYDDQDSAQKAVGLHTLLGRQCEAKKAEPRRDYQHFKGRYDEGREYWMGDEMQGYLGQENRYWDKYNYDRYTPMNEMDPYAGGSRAKPPTYYLPNRYEDNRPNRAAEGYGYFDKYSSYHQPYQGRYSQVRSYSPRQPGYAEGHLSSRLGVGGGSREYFNKQTSIPHSANTFSTPQPRQYAVTDWKSPARSRGMGDMFSYQHQSYPTDMPPAKNHIPGKRLPRYGPGHLRSAPY